jgi:hypothetical protein
MFCVFLDLRGLAGEFDINYRVFLRDAFAFYGEERMFILTDSTVWSQLFAAASLPPAGVADAFEQLLRDQPPLPPRCRFPSDKAVYYPFAASMRQHDRPFLEAFLPPYLRLLQSDRCAGAYVASAAALRATLCAFLTGVAARLPAGAPLHVYWASHGNFLETPRGLLSTRGGYGVVAFRSAEEIADMTDSNLTAEWIARELVLPLAAATLAAPLLWVTHCCWSACIVEDMRRTAAAASGGALPAGLVLVAEKPVRAPLKALYLAPYNDNFAFNTELAKFHDGPPSARELLTRLLRELRVSEVAFAAHRVRLQVQLDVYSWALPGYQRPAGEAGDAPAPRVGGGGRELRAAHWPERSEKGTMKRALSDWNWAMSCKAAPSDSDARFAAAHEAAAEAAGAAFDAAGAGGLHDALAGALRAAAAALRGAVGPAALAAAEEALQEGERTGLHEEEKERFWLAPGPAAAGDAGAVPSGGAERWEELRAIVNGDARPAFFARLRATAFASASLCTAFASRRLEAVATFVGALRGPWADVSSPPPPPFSLCALVAHNLSNAHAHNAQTCSTPNFARRWTGRCGATRLGLGSRARETWPCCRSSCPACWWRGSQRGAPRGLRAASGSWRSTCMESGSSLRWAAPARPT